jgi:hypothetical protein
MISILHCILIGQALVHSLHGQDEISGFELIVRIQPRIRCLLHGLIKELFLQETTQIIESGNKSNWVLYALIDVFVG